MWFWEREGTNAAQGYRPRQCQPRAVLGKDLSLVSGGKTTKEFAGYSRVPTLPPQTSLSSLPWPCQRVPRADIQKIFWELRLCWDLLLQSGYPRTVSLQSFPGLFQP